MTALLTPRFWIGLALVAVLTFTHGFAYKTGRAAVRSAWDKERAEQMAAALAAEQAARTKEQNLQATADTLTKAKNAEIDKLNRGLAAALDSLHKRADRPAVMPATAGVGASCTGASLYRSDAEFLTRLAARADGLLAQLGQCQTQYQAARQALMPATLHP